MTSRKDVFEPYVLGQEAPELTQYVIAIQGSGEYNDYDVVYVWATSAREAVALITDPSEGWGEDGARVFVAEYKDVTRFRLSQQSVIITEATDVE